MEFNSQHDVLNNLGVLSELIEGADKSNCAYLVARKLFVFHAA